MRILLAGLIVVLGAMGSSYAGEGEADAMGATPEKEGPGDCQIKGDIGPEGERLYHRPGERDYEWAWISEAKGERWFCSVDEAEAAGWRPAE